MNFSEAATASVLWKKLFLKTSQHSQESCRPATLLKRDSNTGFFLWILRNFQEHLFWRTSVNHCLWFFKKATEHQFNQDLGTYKFLGKKLIHVKYKVSYVLNYLKFLRQGTKTIQGRTHCNKRKRRCWRQLPISGPLLPYSVGDSNCASLVLVCRGVFLVWGRSIGRHHWILDIRIGLQQFAGYLGLTLLFMWDSALREGLLSVFQEIFASVNKIFILAGGLAAGLLFYGIFRVSWYCLVS